MQSMIQWSIFYESRLKDYEKIAALHHGTVYGSVLNDVFQVGPSAVQYFVKLAVEELLNCHTDLLTTEQLQELREYQ